MKSGIFGIESGNNGRVQGGRLCHESSNSSGLFGGAKGPSNRLKRAQLERARANGPGFRQLDSVGPNARMQAPPPFHPSIWLLVAQFAGKQPAGAEALRTPALVIDRQAFFLSRRCTLMRQDMARRSRLTSRRTGGIAPLTRPCFLFSFAHWVRSLDCGRNKAPACFLFCYHPCRCRI